MPVTLWIDALLIIRTEFGSSHLLIQESSPLVKWQKISPVTGDSVFHNFQVEDAIKGESWKNKILGATKLKLVPRSTFATL